MHTVDFRFISILAFCRRLIFGGETMIENHLHQVLGF